MFVPVKGVRSADVLKALESWFAIFGHPRCILSDNGPQFVSHMFGDAMKQYNIECRTTSTYHPECNGMIERLHRWLKERLALIAFDAGLNFLKYDDWSPYLKIIAFAYNTTPNKMTTAAPSELIFGYNPTSMTRFEAARMCKQTPREYVDWLARRIALIRGRAVRAASHYDAVRKRGYDRQDEGESFEVGSAVMYDASGSRTGNERKLLPDYIGPLEIIRSEHDGQSYKLRSIEEPSLMFWAPRKHLKQYKGRVSKSPVVALMERQRDLWAIHGEGREEADARASRDAIGALMILL
jgi:hypothetical protein